MSSNSLNMRAEGWCFLLGTLKIPEVTIKNHQGMIKLFTYYDQVLGDQKLPARLSCRRMVKRVIVIWKMSHITKKWLKIIFFMFPTKIVTTLQPFVRFKKISNVWWFLYWSTFLLETCLLAVSLLWLEVAWSEILSFPEETPPHLNHTSFQPRIMRFCAQFVNPIWWKVMRSRRSHILHIFLRILHNVFHITDRDRRVPSTLLTKPEW